MNRRTRADPWTPLSLSLAAGAYFYLCAANRFSYGLSVAYTGAFEILSGKMPYRDFYIAVGPMVYLIQAFFFKIFGFSYWLGFRLHAAVFNAAATWLTYDLVLRRYGRKSLAVAAACLTAVWYYPIFHSCPDYDPDSFFFLIAALWALQRGEAAARAKAGAFYAGCGVLVSLSFYTKQSAGGLGIACLLLYLAGTGRWRAARWFLAGAAAGILSLGALFSSWGGFASFARHFLILPLKLRGSSFSRDPRFWAGGLACAAALHFWRPLRRMRLFTIPLGLAVAAVLLKSPAYFVFLVPLILLPVMPAPGDRALLTALVLLQLGGRLVSSNEIKQFWALMGILFAIAAHAFLEWKRENPKQPLLGLTVPPWVAGIWTWSLFAVLFLVGINLSYGHQLQAIFPRTTFYAGLFALSLGASIMLPLLPWSYRKGLGAERKNWQGLVSGVLVCAALGLFWKAGNKYVRHIHDPDFLASARSGRVARESVHPLLRHVPMTASQADFIDSAYAYASALPAARKPIFFYPACELMYPLIGQVLPQPLLWFDSSLTFQKGDGSDEEVVRGLESKRVRTAVLCDNFSTEDMPALGRWLEEKGVLEVSRPDWRAYEIRN